MILESKKYENTGLVIRMKRVGSFIDKAEFLFMRTCSMKKVRVATKIALEFFITVRVLR